jgi:8-oxo-dGTP pyrophosphatase MutT (NUDIX family)
MNTKNEKPWKRSSRKTLVESEWIRHHIDTLKLPSGKIIDFHALEYPMQVAGIIPVGADGKILLKLQYRYMADRYSWEIPAGNVSEGEDLIVGARRELIEETGYDAKTLDHLYEFYPQIGRSDHYFNVFVAQDLEKVSDTVDEDEVFDLRWFSLEEILDLIRNNNFCDGFSATAIMAYNLRSR